MISRFRRPPDGHHIFFAVAGCGAPVASRPACENGTAPSPKRGQPREVRGVAPGDEDEELWGDEKTRKKNTDWKRKDLRKKNEGRGQGEKTRDWCRSNIPNGESCTYLTHNYFTLNHELKQIGKSIPQGLAASHQAATQLEAVQRLKGGKISINFPTLWSWFGFETRCKCDRASQQLAAKSEVLVTSFPICFNLIMTNPTCLFSGMYHI